MHISSSLVTVCLLAVATILVANQHGLAAQNSASEFVYEGVVTAVEDGEIQLRVGKANHSIAITPQTMITVNGTEATLAEVRPGHLATVAARRAEGKLTAHIIDARHASQ